MATKDQSRITKDTSARKDPSKSAMQLSIELKAQQAFHDAYVSGIESEYEQKIRGIEAACATEIEELKSKLAMSGEAMRKKQEVAIKEATTKAREELETLCHRMRTENGGLKNDVNRLQKSLKESIAEKEHSATTAEQQYKILENRINKLKAEQANAWIKITFRGKGRRDKHYLRRPNATLGIAAEEFCKDAKISLHEHYFSRGGSIPFDQSKTLKQLDIGDKSVIHYYKN